MLYTHTAEPWKTPLRGGEDEDDGPAEPGCPARGPSRPSPGRGEDGVEQRGPALPGRQQEHVLCGDGASLEEGTQPGRPARLRSLGPCPPPPAPSSTPGTHGAGQSVCPPRRPARSTPASPSGTWSTCSPGCAGRPRRSAGSVGGDEGRAPKATGWRGVRGWAPGLLTRQIWPTRDTDRRPSACEASTADSRKKK